MEVISGLLKQKRDGKEYECLLCPYAIGDIFITTNELDPEVRYKGTTWQKIEEETYLMSASKKYPVKSTGGENEHLLTVEEIPSHHHPLTQWRAAGNQSWGGFLGVKNVDGVVINYSNTNESGGGQPHNNMPKSFAVYFWLRVA